MYKTAKPYLLLTALLLAVILTSTSGWATTAIKNCPTEPTQNVAITSGITYYGANCLLNTTGDIDSFVFSATAGDTWEIVLGFGTAPAAGVCLTIYAPGSSTPFYGPGCTAGFSTSVATIQNLTTTGTYTVVVTENGNGATLYGLSLERISPTPPDAVPLVINTNATGDVAAPTAQNAYSFYGETTDTYQLTVSLQPGQGGVCFAIYQPNAINVNTQCTAGFTTSISEDVTPTQTGTFVVLIYSASNDATVGYNIELACLLGSDGCKQPPPKCALADALTYTASTGTLTMNFTIGTPTAVTWNAWLSTGNTMQLLWSQSQAVTEPPVKVTKTTTVAKSGVVGVLSTLTTPSVGIGCSNWAVVSTGKP